MASDCCDIEGKLLTKVLPPLLIFEFVLGVLGNGLALWIFCRHMKPWKSSTVFLFNLALADFLLNIALPFRASYYISGMDWKFGDVFCRVSLFMLAMNRSGSMLFLTAIAVDRYLRVVHPHHRLNSITVAKAGCAAVALWALTITMTGHLLISSHISNQWNTTRCESFVICRNTNTGTLWHKLMFVISLYLLLSVNLFCSVSIIAQLRQRQLNRNSKIKKALCFIGIVVVMFIVCFLPSNITQLLLWVKRQQKCPDLENLNMAFYITISLTYLNSMLDPIVYYFSSPSFKRIYKKMVRLSLRKEEVATTDEDRTRESGSQTLSQL